MLSLLYPLKAFALLDYESVTFFQNYTPDRRRSHLAYLNNWLWFLAEAFTQLLPDVQPQKTEPLN